MQIQGREKMLGALVLSCVGVFVIFLLVQGMILKPAKDLKSQRAQLVTKVNKLKKEQEQFKIAQKEVQAAALNMMSPNTDQANGVMGELLNTLIQKVGLNPRQFTRSPVGPNRVGRGLAREVGWTVQGEGPLSKVVDLLYLLESASALHKLEGVRLSATSQPGSVKIAFRYLTLVLEPAPSGVKTNGVEGIVLGELSTPERQLYDGIAARDLFRPYVRRPAGAPQEAAPVQEASGEPAFRAELFKAVSLSEWAGKSEVHLLNTESGAVQVYQAGDTLEGWTLLGVDYRRMPRKDSILESEARVILQNAEGYWALEQGSTLAQLYQIKEEELPPRFKPVKTLEHNDN